MKDFELSAGSTGFWCMRVKYESAGKGRCCRIRVVLQVGSFKLYILTYRQQPTGDRLSGNSKCIARPSRTVAVPALQVNGD
jgi:hypothetical protein